MHLFAVELVFVSVRLHPIRIVFYAARYLIDRLLVVFSLIILVIVILHDDDLGRVQAVQILRPIIPVILAVPWRLPAAHTLHVALLALCADRVPLLSDCVVRLVWLAWTLDA